jgi:hypothetical protein
MLLVVVLSAVRTDPTAVLLSLAWFALFAIPPLATMEADWFSLAPRFLYTTAGGAAILWAMAIAGLAGIVPKRVTRSLTARAVVVVLAATAAIAPASVFVRRGMRLYGMAGEAIWTAARRGAETSPALFVNLPRRMTPTVRMYPVGFEGITPLPQRVAADQLVYVNTGRRAGGSAIAFGIVGPDGLGSWSYEGFGRDAGWEDVAKATRAAHTVYLTVYSESTIELREAGGPTSSSAAAPAFSHVFGGGAGGRIGLRGAVATCSRDGTVRLGAIWQALGPVRRDVSVFAHLVDAHAEEAPPRAQADGYPLLGMRPFWLFEESEAVRDVRYFHSLAPGSYVIRVGLWEPASGTRWTVDDSGAEAVPLATVDCS